MDKSVVYLVCFYFLLVQTGWTQLVASAKRATVVAQTVDSIFADWNTLHTPGGVIAVLYNGEVLLKKGYGMANVKRQIPLTTASLFNIASTSKQFTATCIALLEEQGKLSFDDDIKKYFPQFQLTKTVTIRHLLSHTSGLREAYVLAALSGKVNLKGQVKRRYQTTESLIQLMAKQQDLNFNPGDEFTYTNINYVLLGEIVRRVSGLRLAEYAHQSIFEPLGMIHTYFNDELAHLQPNRATPYQYADKGKKRFKAKSIRHDQGVVGDNNLVTNLDDLILWDQNFLANKLGQHKPSLLRTIQTPYILNNGDTTHYAFGLTVTPYRTVRSVGHGGDDYRYTSFMVRFPDQQLDLICLSNQSRYEVTQSKLFSVASQLLNVSMASHPLVNRLNSIPLDTVTFKEHVGRYMGKSLKNRYSFREVFIRKGKPYLSFQPQPAPHIFELIPIKNQHYLFKVDEPDVYVETWFIPSTQGGHNELVETFKNDTLRFERKLIHPVSTAQLSEYVGVYTNQELASQLKVRVDPTGLRFQRGIITIKAIAIDETTFYAPESRALFHFKRNGSGVISEFRISAADFRNVKYSR